MIGMYCSAALSTNLADIQCQSMYSCWPLQDRSWPELGRHNLGILCKSWESSWKFWAVLGSSEEAGQVLGKSWASSWQESCPRTFCWGVHNTHHWHAYTYENCGTHNALMYAHARTHTHAHAHTTHAHTHTHTHTHIRITYYNGSYI